MLHQQMNVRQAIDFLFALNAIKCTVLKATWIGVNVFVGILIAQH